MLGLYAVGLLKEQRMGKEAVRVVLWVVAFGLALSAAVGVGLVRRQPDASEVARQRAATPAGMVLVPAGEFRMGSDDADADHDVQPRRRVFAGSFYIGRTEVTNREFRRFRPSFEYPEGRDEYPVTGVTYEEAEAYCRWTGGRLPTEAEWEKAARGTDGRRYPWGDLWDVSRGNFRKSRTGIARESCWITRRGLRPVGSFPAGASPYGALDMAGNAWEWVAGFNSGNRDQRIIRGGACGYSERHQRAYARGIEGAGVT
jgi:formylglycine-generating enzyme required for sulfatase activity